MKLALLSGANPQACKVGPTVRLPKGNWRFHVHGKNDSVLHMHVEGHGQVMELEDHDSLQFFDAGKSVYLEFHRRGKEQFITVIAERLDATDVTAVA